jgi:biotin carboxylase
MTTAADGNKKGTLLCIASYEKGQEFMRSAKRCGWTVILLTSQSLKDQAEWPTESLDEIYYMPDVDKKWDMEATRRAVSYLARTVVFDRIVPLDDFDLETAAMLREHLRVPGMGDTTTRYFRDKLAMRVRAQSAGLRVPEFVHLLNDAAIARFADSVPAPWVVKPRFLAGALGIKKAHSREELHQIVDKLGDERSNYVLERFVPGDIYHVDSLTQESRILFQRASRYGRPPLEVSHTGDIFTSRILAPGTDDARALVNMNSEVLRAMRLVRGASHSEFIRGRDDGLFYFLETSARVGGAHLADMVDAATGINLWAEWAKIEIAGEGGAYELPPARDEYAGILVSLAKQEWPNTGAYDDPEVVWRLHKKYHAGLIVRSPLPTRVEELLAKYVERFREDFHAVLPPQER